MKKIFLIQHDDLYLVNLDKVMYFMADDHYTHVHYSTGQNFLVPFGLRTLEKHICDKAEDSNAFVRLGRKYIVNLNRVFHINTAKQELSLTNDINQCIVLHIPKPVLKSLHELMTNHIPSFGCHIVEG